MIQIANVRSLDRARPWNVAETGYKAKELATKLLEEVGVATIGGPPISAFSAKATPAFPIPTPPTTSARRSLAWESSSAATCEMPSQGCMAVSLRSKAGRTAAV